MSIGFIATLILAIAKLLDKCDWSWAWVFTPMLVEVVIVILLYFGFAWFFRR